VIFRDWHSWRGVWAGGITKKMCEGYRHICQNCEEGDRIALFGFSRGAFVVRALVGVMANVGVLPNGAIDKVENAIYAYQAPLGERRRDEVSDLKMQYVPILSASSSLAFATLSLGMAPRLEF
jgi:uncharacterized protein (DUF2235 family)